MPFTKLTLQNDAPSTADVHLELHEFGGAIHLVPSGPVATGGFGVAVSGLLNIVRVKANVGAPSMVHFTAPPAPPHFLKADVGVFAPGLHEIESVHVYMHPSGTYGWLHAHVVDLGTGLPLPPLSGWIAP